MGGGGGEGVKDKQRRGIVYISNMLATLKAVPNWKFWLGVFL